MLKNIAFKREYLLLGSAILLLVVAYRLAFRKTIEQWQLHSQLEARMANTGNTDYQPAYLSRKNANLSRIIRRYKADTSLFRNTSVTQVSLIAQRNGAKLVNIPSQDMEQDTGKIILEKLELTGDYFSLLKTAAVLNRTPDIGWLRSVSLFEVYKFDAKENTRSIHMEVCLEILKP